MCLRTRSLPAATSPTRARAAQPARGAARPRSTTAAAPAAGASGADPVSFASWFSGFGPTSEEIRGEVWRLGVRYQGKGLEGAKQELSGPGLAPARVALLKACVREMKKS